MVELNSERFLILSRMARDILEVPVSTVASEFAFSIGGHVLDAFKSSLTPKIVEALICTQDWLRIHKQPVSIEENIEELEAIEKGYTCSLLFDFCFPFFFITKWLPILIFTLFSSCQIWTKWAVALHLPSS